MSEALRLQNLLISQGLLVSQGQVTFNFFGETLTVTSLDVVGSILQNWFEHWLIRNQTPYTLVPNTQSWPDFILQDGTELEIKAFDFNAGPNFDVANFDAYTRSLQTNAERLLTEHLVFGYTSQNGIIGIKDVYLKKIWELTGPSPTNILNLQVKQGVPVNIRPKNWSSNRVEIFQNRRDFVWALHQALQHFYPQRCPDFFNIVATDFAQKTGQPL
jgi:NgoBV restriction endonuclease